MDIPSFPIFMTKERIEHLLKEPTERFMKAWYEAEAENALQPHDSSQTVPWCDEPAPQRGSNASPALQRLREALMRKEFGF